jgi:catechol 2,3-dioxygenase-like lactoylglutathione lyase family enzyme
MNSTSSFQWEAVKDANEGTEMFKQLDYTMIIVSDMHRSVEFYRDKLGLPLKFQSPDWTEFATGTTTLALHGGGVRNEQDCRRLFDWIQR